MLNESYTVIFIQIVPQAGHFHVKFDQNQGKNVPFYHNDCSAEVLVPKTYYLTPKSGLCVLEPEILAFLIFSGVWRGDQK